MLSPLIKGCLSCRGQRRRSIRETGSILTFNKCSWSDLQKDVSHSHWVRSPNVFDLWRTALCCFSCFLCVCVFHRRATELSPLPYHGEFQSRGRDELVWNKLAVLTAQTAPALSYKLKQKQPYLHIDAGSPWNTIRSASIFDVQQTERLPSLFSLSSSTVPQTNFTKCFNSDCLLFLRLIRVDHTYRQTETLMVLTSSIDHCRVVLWISTLMLFSGCICVFMWWNI